VVDQVPKILGIHFPRGTFIQNALSTVHNFLLFSAAHAVAHIPGLPNRPHSGTSPLLGAAAYLGSPAKACFFYDFATAHRLARRLHNTVAAAETTLRAGIPPCQRLCCPGAKSILLRSRAVRGNGYE
jgi:hypothetical protein